MSRYLRTKRPRRPRTVVRVEPTPTVERVVLDYATWHARLAGWNRSGRPSPAAPGQIVPLARGRTVAA